MLAQFLLIRKLDLNLHVHVPILVLTALIIIHGNIENDILDYELDITCKKKKKNGVIEWLKTIQVRWLFDVFILGFALFSGLPSQISIAIIIAYGMMKLYNAQLKKIAILGNATIAVLCAATICLISLSELSIHYAILIFILTWLREMVKDKEDEACDEQYAYRTLAILLDTSQYKIVLYLFIVVFAIIAFFVFDVFLYFLLLSLLLALLLQNVYYNRWKISSALVKLLIFMVVITLV
jgi:4-hydroxybenzoate polyprenyltransferase